MNRQFDLDFWKSHPDCKVETREGKPARIICTDAYSKDNYPIVALVNDGEREFANSYNPAGRCCIHNYDDDLDLFIVTDEPELTEFEKALDDVIRSYRCDSEKDENGLILDYQDWIKKKATKLLTLAYGQFFRESYIAFTNAQEAADEVQYREGQYDVFKSVYPINTPDTLEEFGKRQQEELVRVYNKGYEEGKLAALKDLPRWKKLTGFGSDSIGVCENMYIRNGYGISLLDLDKLPKEE